MPNNTGSATVDEIHQIIERNTKAGIRQTADQRQQTFITQSALLSPKTGYDSKDGSGKRIKPF